MEKLSCEYSKTVIKQIVKINDMDFPSFTCVRCATELFGLSIGISMECPVTLIYITE